MYKDSHVMFTSLLTWKFLFHCLLRKPSIETHSASSSKTLASVLLPPYPFTALCPEAIVWRKSETWSRWFVNKGLHKPVNLTVILLFCHKMEKMWAIHRFMVRTVSSVAAWNLQIYVSQFSS